MNPRSTVAHVAFATLTACALLLAGSSARAQQVSAPAPPEVQEVAVQEHLGAYVPLDVPFRDHTGSDVKLADYFHSGKPVILNLMYHRCTMLCSVVLDSLANALKNVDWTVGNQFDVVTLSIDPHDTAQIAETKRNEILAKYGRNEASRGWHFLTGREADIHRVAEAVGFEYRWDDGGQQWIHPAAIFILGGDGRIARYLYGVDFAPQDIRFGLLEASEGRTVSTYDKILLACYHWDPKGRQYRLSIPKIMRIGALVILAAVGTLLTILWRRERKSIPPV